MTNLLAQRKEMKRLEKLAERQKLDEVDQQEREEEQARLRAVQEFEAVQMGLEVKLGAGSRVVGREDGKIMVEQNEAAGSKGTKRKFEMDEAELKRIATEERSKAKRTLEDERKAAKGVCHRFGYLVKHQKPITRVSAKQSRIPRVRQATPTTHMTCR